MPRTRLLLILPTTTYKAAAFMDAAARLDVDVTVASEERNVLETASSDRFLALNFKDTDRAIERAKAAHATSPFSGIVAADDACVVVGAAVAEALGLPGNMIDAVRAATHKTVMRERLAGSAVVQPAYELASLDDDPVRLSARVVYPCVLKPTTRFASQGVIRADDAQEFVAAFRRIDALMQRPDVGQGLPESRELLIEEYIDGAEVAFEGLLRHGELLDLAIFDKPDPLVGPFFEETIYVASSRLSADRRQEITSSIATACDALGLREGPVHAEVRLSPDGPVVIEVAARTIGGQCGRSLRFGTDTSLEELVIRHALGMPIADYTREATPSGVMMIPPPASGIFQSIGGLEEARTVPGIEDITITAHAGDICEPAPEGAKYLGFIFARAATADDVEAALRAAYARLRINIATHSQ